MIAYWIGLAAVVTLCAWLLFRHWSERSLLAKSANELAEARREAVSLDLQACESRSRLNAVLEATADAVLFVDSAGKCLLANSAAQILFPDSVGQTLLAITHSPELESMLESARAGSRRLCSSEIALHTPSQMVMLAAVTLVETPEPAPSVSAGFVVVLRDQTDLRRLQTVRQDFVANVSHELRTPLSSITAMTETLLDGALQDPSVARHFLETVLHETDRLSRLSADLLDLSKIESHAVQKTSQDLAVLTRDVIARMSGQIKKSEISFTADIPDRLVLSFDPDEISQVLINLIDNALKYTATGGQVAVAVRATPGAAEVSVADTGIGILTRDLPRIFERFYRVDKARSRASGSTGLGLSIVKHIVERHEGRVWVESEYKRGSVFYFTLPMPEPYSSLTGESPASA